MRLGELEGGVQNSSSSSFSGLESQMSVVSGCEAQRFGCPSSQWPSRAKSVSVIDLSST